jgi:hypothetical protein
MIRNYTNLVWLPNVFVSLAWLFAVLFTCSELSRYYEGSLDKSVALQFKAELFCIVTVFLALWNFLNEYTKCLRLNKFMVVLDWLVRWLAIPFSVLFLVISNDVFKMKISDIDWNFSVFPIILQMLVILILTEILKLDFFCRKAKLNKIASVLLAFVLGFLNFYFCIYFFASWITVHKN